MEPLLTTVQEPEAIPQQTDEQNKMFDWTEARTHLVRLHDSFNSEIADTEVRRKTRKVEINVERLRQEGKLDEDETFIPVRVIDTNIQRELPPYINYLKNSRRLAIFSSIDKPTQDCDLLEHAFTKGLTYTKWEIPHYKTLDGAATHGWDSVEVTFDPSKPLNCGIEHIGHDNLIYPRSATDLQKCPRISRRYKSVTMIQLRQWVKSYGFDQAQVDLILKKRENTHQENETIYLYKCFLKKTNPQTNKSEVFVSWYTLNEGESDWLKKPVLHSVGIKIEQQVPQMYPDMTIPGMSQQQPQTQWVDVPLELYPVFILPYRETEEPEIIAHKGRVYYDENKQEAQTAILSAFVNGLTRASNMYGAPAAEDGSGQSLKELEDVKLVPGRILNKPMQFWSPPYPDALMLRSLQYFDVANSEETGQVNFASLNREDSRKTAKEIGASQQQQQLLNSVQLTLFSTFIREVYSFAWLIVQSQALQNAIKFLMVEKQKPQINPVTQKPVINPVDGQPVTDTYFENDFETIKQVYDVRAAGDVDVIQKDETIQKMQQDWNLVSSSPLKDQFMADYIKLKYPEDAEKYIAILGQGAQMQQMKNLIGQLGTTLQGALETSPDMVHSLPPEQQSAIAQMMQQAQQFMQPQQSNNQQPQK